MLFGTASRDWTLLFLIFLHFVATEQTIITAESGQNITLPCQVANNNINIVEWSRADLGKQCVLMQRDGHFVPEHQHPAFKNRVDLQDRQMKDGDVSVILKNVTAADAGTYECRVIQRRTNRWKRALLKTAPISIIYLRVVAPPDQQNITAESGENVTLTCRAPDDKNDVVEWSRADLETKHVLVDRNEHFDPEEQHPSFKNRVDLQDRQMKDGDVSVILKNVTTADGGTYECRVLMEQSSSPELICIIYLRVVAPPGPSGGTTEEEGSVGLIVGLPVAAVLLVAVVGFLIYKRKRNRDPY